jgi:hypothetical protein
MGIVLIASDRVTAAAHACCLGQVVGLLLDHPGWRAALEEQPACALQLLAALLVTFNSRLWHPASGVLLK